MIVQLAGITTPLFEKAKNRSPEVISAGYARISRSSKNVEELIEEADKDIEKARKSNETIIYGYGHKSIAEHCVFNFNIIGISRFLMGVIQNTRYASFTEKSQRYVSLGNYEYVIPYEISNDSPELLSLYKKMIENCFERYIAIHKNIVERMTPVIGEKQAVLKANEDARYCLPLATKTQAGLTINASSLERLLMKLDAMNCSEATELKELLLREAQKVAPSLVKHTKSLRYQTKKMNVQCGDFSSGVFSDTELVHAPFKTEKELLAFFFFEHSGYTFKEALVIADKMSTEHFNGYMKSIMMDVLPHNNPPRSFELYSFIFQSKLSQCSFSQFRRHRTFSTIIQNSFCPTPRLIIPDSFDEKDIAIYGKYVKEFEKLHRLLYAIEPQLINYITINGSPVSFIFKADLRSLFHFVKLRSDIHAQWEIRELSDLIKNIISERYPSITPYLKGKSELS